MVDEKEAKGSREKTWKEKWIANYRGEGDCQELETLLKE